MAAYVVINITVTDPDRYAEYVKQVPATIAKYGGRYLARGGRTEVLEGAYEPRRFVVLEFDSVERARAWWNSPEYAGPQALRRSASTGDIILVEGIAPPRVGA
jgi:uncharacterized protein (DUF1330 family)